MAIYHFSVAVISRGRGQRIVAVAAAQAAVRLRDDYYGMLHNSRRREGVEFAEIVAPADAPAWVRDRERLWNRVEATELRKDAQLARAIEISLPVELDLPQCTHLLRGYVRAEFVARRMIADMSIRRSKSGNPNAHILLTLREAGPQGFGPKMRQWNRRNNLLDWRSAWANCANFHLAQAGHPVRIDHRSLEAQQVELVPARRTGSGRPSNDSGSLPDHLRSRFEQQRSIAEENGRAILEDPAIAIRALASQRRRFTRADLSRFLVTRTAGRAQLEDALSAILASRELVALKTDQRGTALFTSCDLIEAEQSLLRRARNMTKRGDLQACVLPVDGWPEHRLNVRRYWNERGRKVLDALPIPGEALARHAVVLVEGAEMLDLKTLEKLLDAAERARATLLLVADAERLRVMGGMSPMHDLLAAVSNPISEARASPLDP